MVRRFTAILLSLFLASAPASAQVGRIVLEAPIAPAPSAAVGSMNAGVLMPTLTPTTPGLGLTVTPALASPVAAERVIAAKPALTAETPGVVAHPAAVVLSQTAERAIAAPEQIGRLYDSAPSAPNFAVLSPIVLPVAPAPWRPASILLKPAAAAINAWRASRHRKRMSELGPNERVTLEEQLTQDSLTAVHAALGEGRLQDAIKELLKTFSSRNANDWYRRNTQYRSYQFQGHVYLRFAERVIKLAYERGHARSRDAGLIAEARAAAAADTLLGHEWRATALQDENSGHCAHHALFNAVLASSGFADPLSVHRFVERARELMNVKVESLTNAKGAELAAIQRDLGYQLGVDVGEGMGTDQIKKWVQLLGMSFESRGPPRGDAQWGALLGHGHEVLLSFRMFHERYKHSPEERDLRGHDYELLRHSVYLLGAFDSAARGVRLYMVQDSGSGATDFYTAEELSALVDSVSLVTSANAVKLP